MTLSPTLPDEAFLASLGLAPAEIDAIRQWSRLGDSRASNGGGAAVRSA